MNRLRETTHDVVDGFLDLVLRSGWAAAAAYQVGLQGRVQTHHLSLPIRRADGAPPLRLGFASDFHGGPATHPSLIDEACRALAATRPELILLGGDFVSINVGHVDAVADALGSIPAPLGRYAVLGNHDYRRRRGSIVARSLELHGIEVLHNTNVRLPPPHDDVWICGIDDVELGSPDADAALRDADGTRLVLMHEPDGLLAIGERPFDAAFCGHTHGGQIALPGGKPLVLPTGTLNRRFSHGLFTLEARRYLLVSRGVGCSGVPIRVFASPEVHAVELTSQ